MAEIATIARPYAEALFKASSKDVPAVALWLDELAAIASNAQLLAFADNPKTSPEGVLAVFEGVSKTPLTPHAKNFLAALIENGRLQALPEVASQFRALKNALGGTADAVVHSAFPIAEAALADLAVTLEKRFARKLNVSVVLAPELIGGVRVVVGDEVLDTSVLARLVQMKSALVA